MVLMSVYAEWNELFMTSAQRCSIGEYVHGITEALKVDTQDGAKAKKELKGMQTGELGKSGLRKENTKYPSVLKCNILIEVNMGGRWRV